MPEVVTLPGRDMQIVLLHRVQQDGALLHAAVQPAWGSILLVICAALSSIACLHAGQRSRLKGWVSELGVPAQVAGREQPPGCDDAVGAPGQGQEAEAVLKVLVPRLACARME